MHLEQNNRGCLWKDGSKETRLVGFKRIPEAIVHDMSKITGDFFQVRLFLKEKLFASNLRPETLLRKPGVPTSTIGTGVWNCRQEGKNTAQSGDPHGKGGKGTSDQKAGREMTSFTTILSRSFYGSAVLIVLMTPEVARCC